MLFSSRFLFIGFYYIQVQMGFLLLSLYTLQLLQVPPSLGRELLRCELGSKDLGFKCFRTSTCNVGKSCSKLRVQIQTAQSMFIVKLELSNCRKLLFTFCKARLIENQTRSIEARADFFSVDFSNSAQAHMTCRVLCFALSIKGKTLTTFYCCCLYCVYESLVRSKCVSHHTYLVLSRSRLMSRAW